METPIYTHLEKYCDEKHISFAMPGHKNGRGLSKDYMQCDVTELPKTLNLYGDDEVISCANKLLAKSYGAKKSYILSGGSTLGIQTMIAATLKRGDTLLAVSDCHISVINTCALLGIKLKLINAGICKDFFVPNGTEEIEISPEISAVIVTSPNYYGITKDIVKIAEKCKKANVALLVDEAHGAHFIGKFGLPKSAVSLGADMVCQSAHKTLNALTGGAYLHICSDRADIQRVEKMMKMFSSSSPSYPIAASADASRAELFTYDYNKIIRIVSEFKFGIERTTHIRLLKNDDPMRIVLNFGKYDITGFEVLRKLSDIYSIDAEMADLANVIFIVSPYNSEEDFERLYFALSEIISKIELLKEKKIYSLPPVEEIIVSPGDVLGKETEWVELSKSVGRISAGTVCMYPPATAVIAEGQRISKAAAEYIKEVTAVGADAMGVIEDRIEVVYEKS